MFNLYILIIIILIIIIGILLYELFVKNTKNTIYLTNDAIINGKKLSDNEACLNWKVTTQNSGDTISANCNSFPLNVSLKNQCQPYKCMVNNKAILLCSGQNDFENGKVCQAAIKSDNR
jgi:hypothetical protein